MLILGLLCMCCVSVRACIVCAYFGLMHRIVNFRWILNDLSLRT